MARTVSPLGSTRRCSVEIFGHAGYYAAGMNQHAKVIVHGNAGPGVAENMMSGASSAAASRAAALAHRRTADG